MSLQDLIGQRVRTAEFARLTPAQRAAELPQLFQMAVANSQELRRAVETAESQEEAERIAREFRAQMVERFPEQFTVPGYIYARQNGTSEPVQTRVPILDQQTESILESFAPVEQQAEDGRKIRFANPAASAALQKLSALPEAARTELAAVLHQRLGPLAPQGLPIPDAIQVDVDARRVDNPDKPFVALSPVEMAYRAPAVLPAALRIGGALAGGGLGLALGVPTGPGAIASTAAGAAAGAGLMEWPAQKLEQATGLRDRLSLGEGALNVGLAAIPSATQLKALKGLAPAAQIGIRAGENALLGGGQTAAVQAMQGRDLDWSEIGQGAATGAVMSGAFDAVQAFRQGAQLREQQWQEIEAWARANKYEGKTRSQLIDFMEAARLKNMKPADTRAEQGAAAPEAGTQDLASLMLADDARMRQAEQAAVAPPVRQDPIIYSEFDTGAGVPAAGQREDGLSEWVDPVRPEPILAPDTFITPQPRSDWIFPNATNIYQIPPDRILVNDRVKQFKEGADSKTGVVEGEQLQGRFNQDAPPIAVWERTDGQLEVITGRHRLDLAKRSGLPAINAFVFREKEGFTENHAKIYDAESNIQDEKGSVADYATYFRDSRISEEEARQRGLLSRVKGNAGFHLGRHAGVGLWDLYKNSRIAEAKAVAIARGAPGNDGAQLIAARAARNKSPEELRFFAAHLARLQPASGDGAVQGSFAEFGDDFANLEAEAGKIAQVQADQIKAARERILAAHGAAKRPDVARSMGIDVANPEAVAGQIEQLRQQIARLESPDPETYAKLRRDAGLPDAPPRPPVEPEVPTLPPEDPNQQALFEDRPDYAAARAQQLLAQLQPQTLSPVQLTAAADQFAARAAASGDVAAQAAADQLHVLRARSEADRLQATSPTALLQTARELRAASLKRALAPWEHRLIDQADERLGQRSLELPPPKPEDARAMLETKVKAAELDLQAKADSRLQASDLEVQGNLFDEPGQLELFERRKLRYADPNQLLLDIGDDLAALGRGAQQVAVVRAEGTVPLGSPAKPGGTQGPAGTTTAGGLRMGDASPVAGGSPVDGDRLSARWLGLGFARKYVRAGRVDFIGLDVSSPEAALPAFQVLRNPRFETFHWFGLDAQGKVVFQEAVSSRVPYYTNVVGRGDSMEQVFERIQKAGAQRLVVLHNHPGRSMEPSYRDRSFTATLAALTQQKGLRFDGHLVIDHFEGVWMAPKGGNHGYGIAEQRIRLPEANSPDPMWSPEIGHWLLGTEVRPESLAALGKRIGVEADSVAFMFLNRQDKVNGLQVWTAEQILHPNVAKQLRRMAVDSGAADIVAYTDTKRLDVATALQDLTRQGIVARALMDGRHASAGSGRLWPQTRSAFRVWEDPDLPPRWPKSVGSGLVFSDRTNSPYVQVPLAQLKLVRTVEMPELVRLVRDLTGKVPEIRQLARSRGVFRGSGPSIALDWRIFRDPISARKTLAHEIGHLVDFLPDQTLQRGNLLGRLATLRHYLRSTLDMFPRTPSQALTPEDRAKIRARARDDVRSRLGGRPSKEESEVDYQEWNDEVARTYQQMILEEIEVRKLAEAPRLREELINLSEWWKPYQEAAQSGRLPESYVTYRESGPELYADAVSVLLNSPADLKQRAPTFWRMFFNHVERKPEVKQALLDTWRLISSTGGAVQSARWDALQASFAKGEEIFIRADAARRERHTTLRGWWDRLREALDDVYWPIIRREREAMKAGAQPPADKRMAYLLDEHPLADNTSMLFMERVWRDVVQPLEKDGFSLQDIGALMFHERIIQAKPDARNRVLTPEGEIVDGGNATARGDLANPLGFERVSSRAQLLWWGRSQGLERWRKAHDRINHFRQVVDQVVRQAVDSGIYSKEAYDSLLGPNSDNYATFAVLKYITDNYVPAGLAKQRGTFEEVANTFYATTLKMLSLTRWIQSNNAKRSIVDFLRNHFPSEIQPADTRWDGRGNRPVEPKRGSGQALIEVMHEGRRTGYYVPEDVARAFEALSPAEQSATRGALEMVLAPMNAVFRRGLYPLFIKYNPAFQLVLSPLRDARKSAVNLPGASGAKLAAEYLRNWGTVLFRLPPTEIGKEVRALLQGTPGPVGRLALEHFAVGTPYDNFNRDLGRADALATLARQFRLVPDTQKDGIWGSAVLAPVRGIGRWIEFSGQTFELLPKLGAFQMLTRDLKMPPREAAHYVRNHVGVPNFRKHGRLTWVANSVFPFFNVALRGFQSDAQLATGRSPANAHTHPGAWWLRYFMTSGIQRVLAAAGAAGLLGVALQEDYERIPDYDKENYLCIPIGRTPGGDHEWRTTYLRIPEDETHRLLGNIIHHTIQAATGKGGSAVGAAQSVFDYGASSVPSVNPVLTIPQKWAQFLQGYNPTDDFRRRGIIGHDAFLAGGWEAQRDMFAWTLQETGVMNFIRWNRDAGTFTELATSAVPGLNRLVKTSDAGLVERIEAANLEESKARARARLAMPAPVRQLAAEYHALRRIPDTAASEAILLRKQQLSAWYRLYLPMVDAMEAADRDGTPRPSTETLEQLSQELIQR